MLTNKIFEDFTSQLLQVRDAADFLKLSDGQGVADTLSQARVCFEDALSERLRGLSEAEQVGLLTQILALFKDSKLYNRAPAYLWADLDKIAESGCKWVREHDEVPSIKAFRDDCENQLLTDSQKFITLPLRARYEASNANEVLRMIDEYESNLIVCQLEGIELEDTELDYEESRWVREGLVSSVIEKAQENARKHFQGLAGREKANHWILNPDSWYDVHRESMGLPWLQEKFQASYEAWHFYFNTLKAAATDRPDEPAPTKTDFAINELLIGYTEHNLTNLLVSVGLLVDAQTLAHAEDSKPRTWRAVVEALRKRKHLEAGGDAVALWKALNKAYGPAKGQLPSKRNLQDPMLDHNADAKLAFERAYSLLTPKG